MPPGRRHPKLVSVVPAVGLLLAMLAVPAAARPAGAGEGSALTLTIEPARQEVQPGQAATFTFTVTNTGPGAVHDVFLADVEVPACNAFDLGELAPGATVTHRCTSPVVTEAYHHTAFAAATTGSATTTDATTTGDTAGSPVLALASADVALAADVTGRLVTADTTCAQAAGGTTAGSGTTRDVERLGYRSKRGKVTGVAPSAVTYVSAVTVAAGATVEVRQSVVAGSATAADSVPPPLVSDKSGVSLWRADCRRGGPKVRPTVLDGGATVRVTVPEAGDYLVGITYRTDSLTNRPVPGPTPFVLVTAVDGTDLARSGDALALRPRSL